MKLRRTLTLLIIIVLHFALSLGMAIHTMGIAMAHDDYDAPPWSTKEKAVTTFTAMLNLPLVTLRERGAFEFPSGAWLYFLFAADSFLWAITLGLVAPWLWGKIRRNELPNKAFQAIGGPRPPQPEG